MASAQKLKLKYMIEKNGYGDSDDVYHYDVRDCVDILGQTCRPQRIVKDKAVLPLKP